jgi:rhodanese-related sulfurtransferase
VYAVFGALRAVGIEIDFRSLVRPRYISSQGSSLSQLEIAVRDHGGFTDPAVLMSVAELERSPWPVILHTATEGNIGDYQHWLLYLGTENGMARVVDVSGGFTVLPFAQLLAQWSSIGLVVACEPVRGSIGRERVRDASVLGLLCICLCALRFQLGRIDSIGKSMALPLIGILGGTALLALGYHSFSRDGLLCNPESIRLVQQSKMPVPHPTVSTAELKQLAGRVGVTIVDARFPRDFRNGHIPGAISVPVSASRRLRVALLRDVSKRDRVIVYCQSVMCPYDDFVADRLVSDGYGDVSIYPEGWAKWSSTNER